MSLMRSCLVIFTLAFAGMTSAFASEIRMKSLSYDPKKLEIVQGEAITWKNVSLTEHSATSEASPAFFDTGQIEPGKTSKAIQFDQVGSFVYHCSVHGKTMSGTIVVKAAPK